MSSVVSVTACVVTAVLLVRMLVAGFITRSGVLFSWPMFADPSYCYFELTVGPEPDAERINFWDYAISGDLSLTAAGVQRFLDYLREVRGVHAHGRVIVDDARGPRELEVVDGHLVD